MKKYRVWGSCIVACSMVVEAENEETAIKIANDEFGGLTNYAGMGSCDCLVGVFTSDDERCVFPDSDPEFDDCEEIRPKEEEND